MPDWFGTKRARELRRAYPPHIGPNVNLRDPALADYLGLGGWNDSGERVTESSALALSAAWRAVKLTSGLLAGLPLKTYRTDPDGQRVQVGSIFDNPGGDFYTPYEWKQLVFAHLRLHGNAYLLHMYNQGGALEVLFPIHPGLVTVKVSDDRVSRIYSITVDGTTVEYDSTQITHIMDFSLDGVRGASPLELERNALGTGIAADRAAARMFSSGLLIGGIVTSDEDLDEDQAKTILTGLKAKLAGTKNAGDIAIVNASLKFQPWTMNAEDAQFLESRQYQVAEVARIFGVPVQLLMQDGASSWGSGIQELVRGWQKFDLTSLTSAFEERCSKLLADTRFCEFDYAGLNQGSPREEIELLTMQVAAGLLTVNEARAIRNLPPLSTGETGQIEGEQDGRSS